MKREIDVLNEEWPASQPFPVGDLLREQLLAYAHRR
jgi:hypothetical protein